MRFLVTAGPTREPIDDVRYVSNSSTGLMGYEIAKAAARHGHEVTLVSGPVALKPPDGVEFAGVQTALQMRDEVVSRLAGIDVLVMAAAVSDYRPAHRIAGKRKKQGGEDETWTLELVRNPDIAAQAGRSKAGRVHIGFALESERMLENARDKLAAKNLDFIVANSPRAIGADESEVTLVMADGRAETLPRQSKSQTAERIVSECERISGARRGR